MIYDSGSHFTFLLSSESIQAFKFLETSKQILSTHCFSITRISLTPFCDKTPTNNSVSSFHLLRSNDYDFLNKKNTQQTKPNLDNARLRCCTNHCPPTVLCPPRHAICRPHHGSSPLPEAVCSAFCRPHLWCLCQACWNASRHVSRVFISLTGLSTGHIRLTCTALASSLVLPCSSAGR